MELADDEVYLDLDLEGGELRGARGVTLQRGRLRRVALIGSGFRFAHLQDVSFEDCDLSGVTIERCRLERVELKRCRLTGAQLRQSRASGLVLTGCPGLYLLLQEVNLRGALLTQCQLREATFQDCQLDGAEIRDSDLGEAVLMGGSWKACDVRGSRIDGLRANLGDLRGLRCDLDQAAALLRGAAGIDVVPPGL
ncbi:MAG: pentapeptide repeat-containing protein [Candidatus Dormibacteraceae bacterium]